MLINSSVQDVNHKFPCSSSPYIQNRSNRVSEFCLVNIYTLLLDMMCNLYFSRYKLFNYKNVHIVKPNVLLLNKDFFFFFFSFLFWEGNICLSLLRGSAARRRISIYIYRCTTRASCVTCTVRYTAQVYEHNTRVHRVTPDLIQHKKYCHRSTMINVTLKQTQVRKLHCPVVLSAPKLSRQNTRKHLLRRNDSHGQVLQ